MTGNEKTRLMISKAPDDPKEKDAWVKQMTRIQVAMWVDGKSCCEQCGHIYSSVDDFLRCNPRSGRKIKDRMTFVCNGCWNEYEKKVVIRR